MLLDVPYSRIWIINFYLKFSGPFSNCPQRFAYLYTFFWHNNQKVKDLFAAQVFKYIQFWSLKDPFCQMESILLKKIIETLLNNTFQDK